MLNKATDKSESQANKLNPKLSRLAFFSGLGLSILYIYLFMWKPVGISYLVFSIPLLIVSALPAILGWVKVGKRFIIRFIAVILLQLTASAILFLRLNPVATGWVFMIVPFFYSLLILDAYHPEAIHAWGIFYLLKLPFIVIFQWIAKSVKFLWNFRIPVLPKKARSIVWRILLGVVISLPFLLIFAGLFSSADPEFSRFFSELVNKLFSIWFDDFISFLSFVSKLIVGFFVGLHLTVWHYFSWVEDSQLAKRFSKIKDFGEKGTKKNWDYLVISVFLFLLNALFLTYVIVQGTYIFGGTVNVVGESAQYTYSEYARKGFGELIFVAGLSYLILLVVNLKTELVTKISRATYRFNASLLGVLTLIIGGSVINRILILQDAYGATALRFNSMIWTIGICVLILSVIISAWFEKYVRYTSLTISFTLLLTILFYAVFPTDLYLAKVNYNRFTDTGHIDLPYILNLSDEAMPIMFDLLKDDDFSENGKALVISELQERVDMFDQSENRQGWMSYKYYQAAYYDKARRHIEDGDTGDSLQLLNQFLSDYADALEMNDFENAYNEFWSASTTPVDFEKLDDISVYEVAFTEPGGYIAWDTVNYKAYSVSDYWNGMSVYGEIRYTAPAELYGTDYVCKTELLRVKVEDGEWKIASANGFALGIGNNDDWYYEQIFNGDSTCDYYGDL